MCLKITILSMAISIVAADVSSLYPRLGVHPNSVDYDPNPQYSYSYSVNDAYTGDNHAQEETRQGDNVQGQYSLIEADGSLRTVKYAADPVNGFTAVVEHSGGASRVHGAPSPRYSPLAPIVPAAAYAPLPRLAPVAPTYAPAPTYVTPKFTVAPKPYVVAGAGGASVHTSFSAPHATYHY